MPYSKLTRAINDREREVLHELMESPHQGTLRQALRRSAISIGVGLIFWLALRWFLPPLAASIVALIVTGLMILCCSASYLDRLSWNRRERPKIAQAIASGTVSVERVEATDVIELLEHSDEGPTYFFDVGDGQILHLHGQEMQANKWPNSVFEIVSTVNPPIHLGIFCYGAKLKPRLRTRDFDAGSLPSRTGLIEGNLADIEALIRQAGEV